NQWHHVAATYDAGGAHLFVDGNLVASQAVASTIVQTGDPLTIGTLDLTGDIFSGVIDEVRISNVVRYTGSFTPSGPYVADANTKGLWHFDEGSGSTVADSSGNGNTGTLVNGPAWTSDSP